MIRGYQNRRCSCSLFLFLCCLVSPFTTPMTIRLLVHGFPLVLVLSVKSLSLYKKYIYVIDNCYEGIDPGGVRLES